MSAHVKLTTGKTYRTTLSATDVCALLNDAGGAYAEHFIRLPLDTSPPCTCCAHSPGPSEAHVNAWQVAEVVPSGRWGGSGGR